ncbi:bcl-2-binding component 3 [Sceloporus undulatus]|uniref:bcl-2-binding component 3 n=1 Tax=Sceloporus undulatus TaxID=8520 RepID=UPI001C4A9940|nr:bcl-2-binding component 3 [Sceloporus undulatus]
MMSLSKARPEEQLCKRGGGGGGGGGGTSCQPSSPLAPKDHNFHAWYLSGPPPANGTKPWRRKRALHLWRSPPSAMARPLQDGSRRTEPTAAAAVSGSPAFPLGGTVALPPTFCRSPRPWTPRLNGGRGPCGPSPAPGHGSLHPGTLPGATQQSPRGEEVEEEGAAAAAAVEPEHGAAEANGHLPRHLPTLEQQIGARLRQMGDRFQQEYEQRERRPHGALWGHFYHLVFHMLGVLYNLPVRG